MGNRIKELKNYLKDHVPENWAKVWIGYFLYLLSTVESEEIKGISELKGKSLEKCINYIDETEDMDLINIIKKATTTEKIFLSNLQKKDVSKPIQRKIILVIQEFEFLWDYLLPNKNGLLGLFESISFLRKNNLDNINVKIFFML
ncbi:MAG: hypothetical protein KAX49_19110 [Halanaerobiales bacterium]|nr:hypothetical protein [Halanaerobiales bacterium]